MHYQLNYIRRFYSDPEEGWVLDRPFPYLNEATMACYVRDAADDIITIFAHWNELNALAGPTALALLAPERLAPYPSPLGDVV